MSYADTAFNYQVDASATSGLPVSLSLVSGPATISDKTLTITGEGSIVVQAVQEGDENYLPASSQTISFKVKRFQSIDFADIPDKTLGDPPFPVTATSSSGLPVTISIVSGPAIIANDLVTIIGAGNVVIQAFQAGDVMYSAATLTQNFIVNEKTQSIDFPSIPEKTYGDPPFLITATSSSGLPVTFSILSGPATIKKNVITLKSAGIIVVKASEQGNDTYKPVNTTQSVIVKRKSQSISFPTISPKIFRGTPLSFQVNPTATSKLKVVLSIISGPASVLGHTIKILGIGAVTVQAIQTGNQFYDTAIVTQTFKVKGIQKIDFEKIPAKILGDAPFAVIAKSIAGLQVDFTILSGPAVVSGNIVTLNGGGTVKIKASQAGSNNYFSAPDVIQSFKVNIAPSVNLTIPDNGSYVALATIALSAKASDADGIVKVVRFYSGKNLIGTDYAAPFFIKWYKVPVGDYTLTAKATDNSGIVTTSDPIHVTVVPNVPPAISIINPVNNQITRGPANLQLQAVASDPDGSITKVEFYKGKILLHAERFLGYSWEWKNVRPGKYIITAKAYDNNGAVTTSVPVNLSVVPLERSTVSITAPIDGATYINPSDVRISAIASNADGAISKVEFYDGTTLLATEKYAAYSWNWKNVPVGDHTITVKAYYKIGNKVITSAPVMITITPRNPPINNRPSGDNSKNEINASATLKLVPNPAHNISNIYTTGLQKNKKVTKSIISPSGVVQKT
ncbi:MAG: Ig-like domain-containing protein, partial [Ferruginibacter sp.]